MTDASFQDADLKGPDGRLAASEQYEQALRVSKDKALDQALEMFLDLAQTREDASKKLRRKSYAQALWCQSQMQAWAPMAELARTAVARYPEFGWGYRYLGEALLRLELIDEARANLEKAIELDPSQTDARVLLEVLRREPGAMSRRAWGWPSRQRYFSDARKLVERYVLRGHPCTPFIRKGSVFTTFGSCFATHIGRVLKGAGYTVHSEKIGEEVNSTYANRYLMEWIEKGPVDPQTSLMHRVYGEEMRERFQQAIKQSDVLIMTLGVAPCFFYAETGEFVFYPSRSKTGQDHLETAHPMRTTTVSENVENLKAILESVQRIAKRRVQVVLTVSPVPLGATTEFRSAVIADCISKSTLRVACHEFQMSEHAADLVYWPSFEMVRWLGPHFGPEHPLVYGAEDGNTRHVSDWVVKLIMELFLECHSEGADPLTGDAPEMALSGSPADAPARA